ncbi:MAG: lysophospholipid acyltransferase family protein [Flavobacteriales bacterium]
MGSKLLYYCVILPISILPYFILYGISNFMYVVMYYVLGYRKKVISENINLSFPDKSERERKVIIKKFYRHFCDLIVEAVKNFTISEKQIKKRVTFKNIEIMDSLFDQGKSVVTIGGHYGNWEMFAVAAGRATKHSQFGIYKPLSSKFFDNKMKTSRGKYGMNMIPMKQTKAYFEKGSKEPITIIFGSDQWPSNAKRAYWTTFLGRETPFLYGAEKYAKDFDWPVVYTEIVRVKRGHFEANYKLLTEKPNETEYGEIIEQFVRMLEETIEKDPAYWLWSHRRWKRTKEEVFNDK